MSSSSIQDEYNTLRAKPKRAEPDWLRYEFRLAPDDRDEERRKWEEFCAAREKFARTIISAIEADKPFLAEKSYELVVTIGGSGAPIIKLVSARHQIRIVPASDCCSIVLETVSAYGRENIDHPLSEVRPKTMRDLQAALASLLLGIEKRSINVDGE